MRQKYTIIVRMKGVVVMVFSIISHDSCHFAHDVSYQKLICILPWYSAEVHDAYPQQLLKIDIFC